MTRAQVLGAAAVVALTACAVPRGEWIVAGDHPEVVRGDVQLMIQAAKNVLPDRKGWLDWGGTVYLLPDVSLYCTVPAPWVATGCSTPRNIWVAYPHPFGGTDLPSTALAHELSHLGLASGGGMSGPVEIVSESRADAGALLVIQEYRRLHP